MRLAHVCRASASVRPLRARGRDDRGRHDVVRGLLERGRQPQHLVGALAGRRLDGDEARAADRQRAGLVEHHGVRARQRLERPAALDQDAAPGRLRDAGDEGDRRGQDQRARRRRDQHGERRGSDRPSSSQAPPATTSVTGSSSSA